MPTTKIAIIYFLFLTCLEYAMSVHRAPDTPPGVRFRRVGWCVMAVHSRTSKTIIKAII